MEFVKFGVTAVGSSELVAHRAMRRSAKGGSTYLLSKIWVSSCALILLGTGASAAEDRGNTTQPTVSAAAEIKTQPQKKRVKKISLEKASEKAPEKAPEFALKAVSPPFLADSAARAAALDRVYGIHGWNIPYPSYGDTVFRDVGGLRTDLAKDGIGIINWDTTLYALNMLNTPNSNKGTQVYWGQKPSLATNDNLFMTYDLSRYGISDGQIALGAVFVKSSWQPYLADTVQLARLTYYQTFFDHKLEFTIGQLGAGGVIIGAGVGGQIQNPFGPTAAIPTELGLSSAEVIQPTVWFNYHITDNWYDTFAVFRSISPTSSAFVDEIAKNPTGFNIVEKDGGAIYVDELGYKQRATSDRLSTWVRAGAVYNTSPYHDFATGGTHTKDGFYALGDQQILQVAPGAAPGRGLYIGASAMYTPPETSIFSQYYEARMYGVGLFDARPRDFMSLVYSHNEISKFAANPINVVGNLTGTFAQYYNNSLIASYTFRASPGVYYTASVGYTDHPSFTFIPVEGSSFNFLSSLFVAF